MKIAVKEIATFLKVPHQCSGVLIYGADRGQMRAHTEAVAEAIVPPGQEAFNRIDLEAEQILDDPARLTDELNALSLMGGRRLVVVREASDAVSAILKEAATHLNADNYLIVCAGELPSRSSLRGVFESGTQLAALPCYKDEGGQLSVMIRDYLKKYQVSANSEIIAYLSTNLGGDRQIILNELEKIALYAGDATSLDLTEVRALVESNNERTTDDLCVAVASGRIEELCRIWDRLCADGTPEIVVIRSLHRYFMRLQEVHTLMATGKSQEQAMKSLRPPVFYKQEAQFRQHVQRWSPNKLQNAMHRLMETERDTKLAGEAAYFVCGQHLLAIASAAGR